MGPPSKTYVSALEARVRTLEALLQASALEIPPADFEIHHTAENEPELSVRPDPANPRPVKPLDPRADLERLPEESGATAAALADIGKLRLEVEKTEGEANTGEATNFTYFGATSSRFLSSIGDIQAGDPTDALPRDQGYTKCYPDSNDEMTFKTYWEWQRIHFPIVDPETFYADYNAGKRNSEFVSPMLLDIIYAVGRIFWTYEKHRAQSDVFEARRSSNYDRDWDAENCTIQSIVMMSMFQMGNGKIPVAWILNGMSVALSTRLGLHIDSSGLVAQRVMSQVTHQPERTHFGPRSCSSLSTTPKTQELPAACWNTLRDLIDIVDYMLGDIYSFDAPKRTAAQDYDLVTKNMLTIQAYIDDMPSPLRVTAALRGQEPCLAFLHVYVNLFILLLNRPFVGPRPPTNANESEQQLERRCRSLAFAHCRKSALRIMELIRHLPRASPCFTTPYFIFSASTVLLLSPNDTQALRGVQVAWTNIIHRYELALQPPTSWGGATFSSTDPTLFAERVVELDAMYIDSLPEAAEIIPWAGAVEPSWGTMGTHNSPSTRCLDGNLR
ncbi:Fungal specific transcription factor domain [Rhizoctonia solani]|uniref:Fungal specific transcription factor domain n=1 Tax=Rhizoctonia solani TaxID=456999 RepID=A0A8H7IFR5_9AGAM|nr:Fungal specific transcription factor domain [Rhizoctonia solani]